MIILLLISETGKPRLLNDLYAGGRPIIVRTFDRVRADHIRWRLAQTIICLGNLIFRCQEAHGKLLANMALHGSDNV